MLLKNVRRTLSKKWMQLTAISIIIILSSFIYTMMFYGISGIEEPTETFLEEYNQEDFAVEMMNQLTEREIQTSEDAAFSEEGLFTLHHMKQADDAFFYELMEERIEAFEEENDGTRLELREIKEIHFDDPGAGHKAMALKDSETINRSFIQEGRKPEEENHIALTKIYADKNGLDIGDSFTLHGEDYTITGFVLFPDYTLPMFDDSFTLDTGMQTLFLFTDETYEALSEDEEFRLAGIWTNAETALTYESGDTDFVVQIIDTETNFRSGAIYDELSSGKIMALGLSIFIASIAVIIVSLMMHNLLQAERGQIGILKALGYSRTKIALPYYLSLMLLAFFMLVLGYIFGFLSAEPLKNLYLEFYLLPEVPIAQQLEVFSAAILVPFFFFAAVSALIISRILGEQPLELLNPKESHSINFLTRFVSRMLRGARGSVKFKYLHAVRSTGSFLIFFLGIMFATILILFAFMMNGMMERLTTEHLEKTGYQYEAYLDPLSEAPGIPEDAEKFLVYPYGSFKGENVVLQGLEPGNDLHHLYDENGNDITREIEDGVVISETMRMKFGVDIGDTILIGMDQEEVEVTVRGVAEEYVSDKVYFARETLSLILTDEQSAELYSGIYSLSSPPDADFAAVISKEGLIDQNESLEGYMYLMTNIMVGGSGIIAASILFVLTSFTVEKNYYAISLLKVMGYNRREVNGMILNSYFVYALLSYLISIPIALLILRLMVAFFAGYGVILPLRFEPVSLGITLGILLLIFFISTYLSRRKINRIPLQEVLKKYHE
ncbi:ABC transporter permease [Alkalicoccus halolimnae]|uniref:FtsX-like permease family protein n=1 Tax=Alkalicoccus halolimnae TaxID=1667239 RepID=A0A5C7F393_9BACI|nr:FtsX-like permease family protein [Alkalicoccus halolimnae]TXF83573.1 FtsX-like permease family protein [Alkalicoccus halolimnae]